MRKSPAKNRAWPPIARSADLARRVLMQTQSSRRLTASANPARAMSGRRFAVRRYKPPPTQSANSWLSESMYFKLRNQGLGPDEMSVGSRRIISFEAAERWRREREAAAIDAG